MGDGCYDLDGKCVNCGEYHPCSCESKPFDAYDKETQGFDVPDEFEDTW